MSRLTNLYANVHFHTEPYFILNEEFGSHSLKDVNLLNSSNEGDETNRSPTSSFHTRTKMATNAEDAVDDKIESDTIKGGSFYSWARNHSGPLDELLKSYISTQYGVSPTRICTEGTTSSDEEDGDKDVSTMGCSNEAELMNSKVADCESKQRIRSVSQSTEEELLSLTESEDPSTAQRFSDSLTQRAYEKMLMLDERLTKAVKKEREVKRQRRRLLEKMEEEGITLALGNNPLGGTGESIILVVTEGRNEGEGVGEIFYNVFSPSIPATSYPIQGS